jgi:hypothetical protein
MPPIPRPPPPIRHPAFPIPHAPVSTPPDHRSPITDHRSPITDHRSPIAAHRPRATFVSPTRSSLVFFPNESSPHEPHTPNPPSSTLRILQLPFTNYSPPPQRIAIVPLCSSRTILARPSELSRSTLSDSEGLANIGHIAGMSPRCELPIAHLAELMKDQESMAPESNCGRKSGRGTERYSSRDRRIRRIRRAASRSTL